MVSEGAAPLTEPLATESATERGTGVGRFGLLLRRHRQASQLTQEELAGQSDLSVRAIADAESGRTKRPHRRSAEQLAVALGLAGPQRAEFLAAARGRPAAPSSAEPPANQSGTAVVGVPQQLPAAVRCFTGREVELATLTDLLGTQSAQVAPAVLIIVIDGSAGVGKTTLAVHWAYRVASSFPDGQLYLNLNGFGPASGPLRPVDALGMLLEALQVPSARIPVSLAGRTSLWRSVVAGRQLLVVLDNARDESQVRPLLPGGADCVVVVTSRSRLTGLVALEGARSITLGVLSQFEARQLVAARLGAEVAADDPDATDRLIGACARLPLALAIATALVATWPGRSVDTVARELSDAACRLEALDAGDASASLRAVFTWSYNALTPTASRMFCLLAEHRGPDITVAAAASLAGMPTGQAAAAVTELARANLVTEYSKGRFGFHDLLRHFATRQLGELYSTEERGAAGRRMLDHYTRTATAAAWAITPQRNLENSGPAIAGTRPERICSQDEAFAWLRAEHAVLMRVIGYAADSGADDYASRLPLALTDFQDRAGYWHDWAACQLIALAAAERLGDIAAQSNAHRYLGRAFFYIQQDDALHHLTRSVELRHQIGPPAAEAGIYIDISRLHEQRGDAEQARQSAEQALNLYQAAHHRIGEAHALNAVGYFHALVGDYSDALRFCSEALSTATQTSDRRAEAQAWESLGFIYQNTGDASQAVSCYERSLRLHRHLADRYLTTKLLTRLGEAHEASGDFNAATRVRMEALAILDDLGHPDANDVRARLTSTGRRQP